MLSNNLAKMEALQQSERPGTNLVNSRIVSFRIRELKFFKKPIALGITIAIFHARFATGEVAELVNH